MASQNNKNIVYVTRDIERALGKNPTGDYFIITNKTPYALDIQKKYPDNTWLIDSSTILDTYEILLLPEVQSALSEHKPKILVFKNTPHIEDLCREKGFELMNPSAELSEKIENKITQVSWLGELSSYLPPHKICLAQDIEWQDKAVVLQWAHGHTGDGTILVSNKEALDQIKEKFPHREARVTEFIKGPMFTVNIVACGDKILVGNISYQITGILPFTENSMSTIGNDWSITHTLLTETHLNKIQEMAVSIGEKIRKDGWKGLFGIDIIYDEERDAIHLIEINARQPASTTFESELQSSVRSEGVTGITMFEAHINSLLDTDIPENIIEINDGAQILQRVTTNIKSVNKDKLEASGYKTIEYTNEKINSDLLRIQSAKGIMEAHMKFNKRGKEITDLIIS